MELSQSEAEKLNSFIQSGDKRRLKDYVRILEQNNRLTSKEANLIRKGSGLVRARPSRLAVLEGKLRDPEYLEETGLGERMLEASRR